MEFQALLGHEVWPYDVYYQQNKGTQKCGFLLISSFNLKKRGLLIKKGKEIDQLNR